jgi:hypothetical protein
MLRKIAHTGAKSVHHPSPYGPSRLKFAHCISSPLRNAPIQGGLCWRGGASTPLGPDRVQFVCERQIKQRTSGREPLMSALFAAKTVGPGSPAARMPIGPGTPCLPLGESLATGGEVCPDSAELVGGAGLPHHQPPWAVKARGWPCARTDCSG